MISKLNWQAYTSENRQIILEDVKAIIFRNDGCIMNHTMFSDLAINFMLEVEGKGVKKLHRDLSQLFDITDLVETDISLKR